ncbi:MAG: 3-phosphoserine/phosphohydroxythreonine transaminase [Polyangiaceae bacterium]|nr:3-phosphoserine/phosphohydroxythreonine transaminase [Polyangiaceae bacterium]MCW5791607.1 3-phosphoserine/phosphohydroxythreonine transaminase [Polyangiaceae bacterium]
MARVINFNAGPAALPLAALERAQAELLDLGGTGMSVIEHSHRGKAYEAVHQQALGLVRELLAVPDSHEVLLLQGGASLQFAMVPMNFLPEGQSADYIITGSWSKKALGEAKLVGKPRVACDVGSGGKYTRIPTQAELDLSSEAAYVHITSNNTIAGSQWQRFPETSAPLIADMSSDVMWRPIDVSKFGLIYAGAQKNLGPSGLVLVIIDKALLAKEREGTPAILRYSTHAENGSLYNTPPTFSIYLLRNVLELMKEQGGLAKVEQKNRAKSALLYSIIDQDADFYRCPVEQESRSHMNVVFNLPTPELEAEFIKAAGERSIVGIKGHRSVGGVRVSIYNAAELAWVEALVSFMADFRKGK